MQNFVLLAISLLSLFVQSPLAFASGGAGASKQQPQRQVDQAYEGGKSIFNGRAEGKLWLRYSL
ncbi:MAG: hypothetical protein ACI854_001819 [Arenicella sp.]|mgnify:CR=1 FL=1|jgi:hypothetical protein